jgi:hypothetical protein
MKKGLLKTLIKFSAIFLFLALPFICPYSLFAQAEQALATTSDSTDVIKSTLPVTNLDQDVQTENIIETGCNQLLDSIQVIDTPKDDGKSINITWTVPENFDYKDTILRIGRKSESEAGFTKLAEVDPKKGEFVDETTTKGGLYSYKFKMTVSGKELTPREIGHIESKDNWYEWNVYHWNSLCLVLFFTSIVIFFITKARRNPESLFIRRISSLDSIEEAVGRSTEMGRKMLYIPGLGDISDPQTVASLSILGHVAKVTAEYGAELEVPNNNPLTMATAREMVKEAYTRAAKPDAFREDMVNFLTSDQFAYTAGVNGKMVRERPAANFFVGWFAAESLIMAETGQSTGAIQVAGTAQIDQLPFFVAACDYTMIGEELYAAGAYLSREPMMLGSLKAQDFVKKYLILIIGFISVIGFSIGFEWFHKIFSIE